MCAKFFEQIYSQLTLMRTMNLILGKSKNKKMKSILQSNAMESIIRTFFSIQETLNDSLITSITWSDRTADRQCRRQKP